MHMSDTMVSATVGTTMALLSAGTVGYSIKKMKDVDLNQNTIPMMGVMGAFVFAAQMVNFTIPGTGSSGHIGGGILLAALLGPFPAFLVLTSVLIIQALFFADGGLLALGCNIFNMGVMTCFVAHPLIYKGILKKKITTGRLTLGSILSVVVGLQLGAFGVVAETSVSNITSLPFGIFLLVMQPIHLAIGIVEGIVTGAVLCFVYKTRKDIITGALEGKKERGSIKGILVLFAIGAVIIGGFMSYFSSSYPDGLEWSIQKLTGQTEIDGALEVHQQAKELQEKTAVLPDYTFAGENQDSILGTGLSGILGGVVTLAFTIMLGLMIVSLKKKREQRAMIDSN